MLEYGISLSPSNWALKLLLTQFYGHAGCGSAAAITHATLDVKHLMLDSLGWVLAPHLRATGHFPSLRQSVGATMKFYSSVHKDTADHIITAYRSGTFYQVRDFYGLRSRINLSHN